MNIPIEMGQDFKNLIKKEILFVSNKTPIAPFIKGEAGIGKSSIIEELCNECGWAFFLLPCNQLGEKTDLTGCRTGKTTKVINGTPEEIWSQIFFPHAAVQAAMTYAQEHPDQIVILFLDEIKRTSSDVTSALLSFTTARTIGTYTFPDNVHFILAGNDKGNIQVLDEASISRFAMFTLIPTAEAWMEHEKNVNPYIEAVLKANPDLILCKTAPATTSVVDNGQGDVYQATFDPFDDGCEGFKQFATPRTISGLNAFLNGCSDDELQYYIGQQYKDIDNNGEPESLLRAIIVGHVGDTEFADMVCKQIGDDIKNKRLTSAITVTIPVEPAFYKSLLVSSDRTTRDNMIANLSDEEKSELLLYTVYDTDEAKGRGKINREIIQTAAMTFKGTSLTAPYNTQFSALKSADQLNADNYAALVQTKSNLANTIMQLLGTE